ncbi:MAG: M48 family metalloprotease [Candidatus Omnitrophota bacterium]|nr:M48 family metalloprotease [Candidatus Omnitrophota bacterium]
MSSTGALSNAGRSSRIHRTHFITLFFLALFTPFAAGIMSFNPAIEEEELVVISSAREKDMGRKIHKQVLKQFNIPVDPLQQKRVEEIGRRLALGTDRRDIVYRFTVINHEKDEMYNAFAAPGGYIYIFDDLVEVMETDDNVAAVLAHEMGHVEARHSVKGMQANIGLTALMFVGAQMKSDRGTRASAGKAIGQLMAAYSRHDERQADELSVKYLRKAGFDPGGAVRSMEVLKRLRKKGPRWRYSVYKSHPYLSERISYLRKHIKGETDFDSYINLVTDDGF